MNRHRLLATIPALILSAAPGLGGAALSRGQQQQKRAQPRRGGDELRELRDVLLGEVLDGPPEFVDLDVVTEF